MNETPPARRLERKSVMAPEPEFDRKVTLIQLLLRRRPADMPLAFWKRFVGAKVKSLAPLLDIGAALFALGAITALLGAAMLFTDSASGRKLIAIGGLAITAAFEVLREVRRSVGAAVRAEVDANDARLCLECGRAFAADDVTRTCASCGAIIDREAAMRIWREHFPESDVTTQVNGPADRIQLRY